MRTQPEANAPSRIVPIFLPWLIAAVFLGVYLVTLNPWVSLNNLHEVARLSGWTWQPELHGPVFCLLVYPLKWLPRQHIPAALNLFSCACAVLTLALLVRSVILLPQDRTQAQRRKVGDNPSILVLRLGWLPPLFAAVVCGLQLTFWENATAASSQAWSGGSNEMLDLLIFAYVVRCVLEYRLDFRERWLLRAALVYGAGMANNWAMIGFFPAFLLALVWTNGLSFFNVRFLSRMFLCGAIGLLFYLLLPLTQGFEPGAHVPFWSALKINLVGQKNILLMLFKYGRQNVLLLSLTSLVPLLLIGIRWSSYFGDTSEIGVALATFMFHAVHALFLLACIWVALDPAFSPRNKGWGIPFLTFYYVGALCVGYFSGYFLIAFSNAGRSSRRIPGPEKLANLLVTGGICLVFIATPAALLYRNWPQIRLTNGPALKRYAELLARGLPARNVVLLSDDDQRLLLMQALLSGKPDRQNYLLLNTDSLKWADYHRYIKRKYGPRWPAELPPKDYVQQIDPIFLVQTVNQLQASNSVYYLQPSFGYYFEYFAPQPHGMTYRLVPYPSGSLLGSPLSPKLIEENNAFWKEAEPFALKPLERALATSSGSHNPSFMDSLLKELHLAVEHNPTATTLAGYYSRCLDFWGVELQKSRQLTNAAVFFERAVALNPENVVAQLNLECNKNLQAGKPGSVEIPRAVEDEFGKYRSWDAVIGANGPFDEPNLCFEQGRVYVRNNLQRQAAQAFDRAMVLAPENLDPRLWLAQLYVLNRMPSEALKLIEGIRKDAVLAPAVETNLAQMLFVESSAYLFKGDVAAAEKVVNNALSKAPKDPSLLATAAQVYKTFQIYSNALTVIDKELALAPDDLPMLIEKGLVSIMAQHYPDAIPPLSHALELDPGNYAARLNRAIAYLRANQLEEGQKDYEILQKAHPTDSRIYYGLAEIAWRKKEFPVALRNYELYISNANTNTAEGKVVLERVQKLKAGSAP